MHPAGQQQVRAVLRAGERAGLYLDRHESSSSGRRVLPLRKDGEGREQGLPPERQTETAFELAVARIVFEQQFVVLRRLAEGVGVLVNDGGAIVFEPRNAEDEPPDGLADRQAALRLAYLMGRVGDARRLAVSVDVGGVEQRMRVQREV